MLRHLSVRDIVLIDRLDLDFPAGLCALTGETGAGKSILLDALGLALGGRGGGDLVRAGAPRGSVSAQFDLADDHPAIQWLEENGYDPSGDGLLTLRRVVNADGKGRAYINDLACGVGALKALGGFLVEIQGQFDDRGLLNPAGHRGLLDAYGGFEGAVAGLRALHRALNEAEAARDTARKTIQLNSRLGNRGPRSFDSKFRNHCTKKLDGALRKSTLYI